MSVKGVPGVNLLCSPFVLGDDGSSYVGGGGGGSNAS